MKNKVINLMLTLIIILNLVACSGTNTDKNSNGSSSDINPEWPTVRIAMIPSSGHVFDAISRDKGFYEEEGINVEIEFLTGMEQFQGLLADQVDIASTGGTNFPLQMIGTGSELTIIGGYMLTGAMPIVARQETEFNGIESFIGSKVAATPAFFQVSGPLLDAGYDPNEVLEWVELTNNVDRIEAVRSGEADYAVLSTGVGYTAMEAGLKEVTFSSDLLPNYSCCRAVASTKWLEENRDTAKKLFRAWLRAQQVFEQDRAYALDLMASQIDIEKDQIAHYLMDEKHFQLNLDPAKNIVSRAWYYLDETGIMDENSKVTDLEDHIDVTLYKEVLDEVMAEHYDEDPAFYDKQVAFYEEGNTKTAIEYLKDYGYTEYLEKEGILN